MRRIDRKRIEALLGVKEIAEVLISDLAVASERFGQEAIRFTPGSSLGEIAFWSKTAARTFFSFIDGASFALRRSIVDYADELGVELTEKRRLELQELRRTKDGKIVPAHLTSLESVKLGFRHFPELFGIEYKLDVGGEHWKALFTLATIRNEITHPETLEHLAGKDISRFWLPSYTWFLAKFSELLACCAEVIPEARVPVDMPKTLPFKVEPRSPDIFSDADYATIRSGSLKTLEYAKQGFGVLMQDTSRAMGLSSSLADVDTLGGAHGQFGLRNWVRTFVSEVEGTIAIATFFILAAAERGEFSLSDEDRESLNGEFEKDEHIARIMNIWSREFGHLKQVTIGGSNWQAFRQVLKLRDRLVHPRAASDLRISIGQMDAIVAADNWFRKVTDLVYLDPDNWARKARDL